MRTGVLTAMLRFGPALREEVAQRQFVEDVIEFLEIEALRKRPVGSLPYGLQKRVELGRALAAQPRILLLDEPMGGMNVEEKEDMARFILDVNEEWGTTIVLIEHDMGVVMDIFGACDRPRSGRKNCGRYAASRERKPTGHHSLPGGANRQVARRLARRQRWPG
jgi:ABC-type branched-subunit amino acid transport system ATPase component